MVFERWWKRRQQQTGWPWGVLGTVIWVFTPLLFAILAFVFYPGLTP